MDSYAGAVGQVPDQDEAPGAAVSLPGRPLRPTDPPALGEYELLARLGEGGMGTVYLGRAPGASGAPDAAGRLVAVKVVRPELADDPEYRARFRREAQIARRVARFCTAEVLAVAETPDGAPYLVTEFIAGQTLADAVAGNGPLASADVERVAVSVAAALTAIHGAGLVHRDLKPSNVLLSPLGPRVIDFGIAWASDSSTITRGRSVGTPAFMAPEQAREAPVSSATDVFAWGGLIVFASTGRPPFGTGSVPSLLYRIATTDVVLDGLDPALAAIVRDAMRRDPAERPTAEEILNRMIRLGVRVDATPIAPIAPIANVESVATGARSAPAAGAEDAPAATKARDEVRAELAAAPTELAAAPTELAAAPTGRARGRRGTLLVAITALSVLLAGGAVAFAVRGALGDRATGTGGPQTLTVPVGLIGLRVDDAEARLRTAGFAHVGRVTKPDGTAPAGTVVDVNPASGSDIARSTKVVLTVSAGRGDIVGQGEVGPTAGASGGTTTTASGSASGSGPGSGSTASVVPDVVGQPSQQALRILAGAGFTQVTVTRAVDDRAAEDTVLSSDPAAGTKADPSALVRLTVSSGAGHTTVADVVGRGEADARSALTSAGLEVVVRVQRGPSTVGPGLVEKVDPAAGTQVAFRTTVTITVVSAQVSVPDVVGQARADAENTLRGYGLDVVVQRQTSERPAGTVLAQSPAAGTVRRGTTVTITVAMAPTSGSSEPPPVSPPPPSSAGAA